MSHQQWNAAVPAGDWLTELEVPPQLQPGLKLWTVRLDLGPELSAQLEPFLSQDEQARAGRFLVAHARRQYVISRGALRQILARSSQCHPAELHFVYSEKGKPLLDRPASSLQFNLAHSGELALIAVAWGRQVGVDLESSHDCPDFI